MTGAKPPTRRVYRETEDGTMVPVPIVDTEQWPTAAEVVRGMRDYLSRGVDENDLLIVRTAQVRVLVERIDEIARGLRQYADRIAGFEPPQPPT